MSYAAQASRYREMEVLAASPPQLVVILFDHLLVTMRRAQMAMEHGDIEARTTLISKSRAVISELLVTLDFEKGGEIATQLSALYTFLLAELLDVGIRRDVVRMQRLTGIVNELRDAFAGAAAQVAAERARA